MGFRKILYKYSQNWRNPSLDKWYYFLLKSDKWSLQELESYQEKKVIELVDFARKNSAFYNHKYEGIRFDSISDLESLPVLEKEDLIQFRDEIQIKVQGKWFWAKTSGSTGSSLKFRRNESADSFSRAVAQRGYHWYGVHPADRNLYFWGFSFKGIKLIKTRVLDFLQNRYRVFDYSQQSINRIKKMRTELVYLNGYSSMLNDLAIKLKGLNLNFPKLKLIKATSEEILPIYRKNVIDCFGTDIVSEYGATESGIIAFQCPEGKMHITMEGVIVEEIDGEILVTNLHLKSFPIIRYRLGDYIELDHDAKCKCGRKHKVIKNIQGRVGSMIYGKTSLFPSLVLYRIFGNLADKGLPYNYQVFQPKKGYLEVRLEGEIGDDMDHLKIEFTDFFGDEIDYVIKENYNFGLPISKKKFFISEL